MNKDTAAKTVVVLTRVTPEQAEKLDEVQAMKPALKSRSEAVRRLLDLLTDDDLIVDDAAEGKEEAISVAAATELTAALQERTRELNELVDQTRSLGTLLNQIARAGNVMAKRGVAEFIDPEVTQALQLGVDAIRNRVSVIAQQDIYAAVSAEDAA